MKKITTGLISLAIITAALFPSSVFAETTSSSQALEIAPPVLSLSADPGQTITADINLRDISTGSLVVNNEINNFTAAGDDGTPKIILDGSDDNDAYSLKNWITPLGKITLEPKEIKTITVTITVPKDAAPGGYYSIIRFSGTAPELDTTGVSLSASLGSLIFLKVNGTINRSMDISSFTVSNDKKEGWIFESSPIDFAVKIKNDGNIYEQPVGKIVITDMFNKNIANVNVNIDQKYVLSETTRKFESSLDESNIGKKVLFGRYKADLTVVYGDNQQITRTIYFWVIPYRFIGICIAITIVLFFVLRFLIRQYNKKIIEKAQGSARTKTKRK